MQFQWQEPMKSARGALRGTTYEPRDNQDIAIVFTIQQLGEE
jgi:hypothetical protein